MTKMETAARMAAADALWREGSNPSALLESWPAPDPEEEAILIAAASLARRKLGAPIAAAALAGSQAGVILPAGDRVRIALPVDDPIIQLVGGQTRIASVRNASEDPLLCESALCARGVMARTVLAAPIRLPGGPTFGVIVAAAQNETEPTDRQRQELIRIGERTAEEVLERYAARIDPETGALTMQGLAAAVRRESRRAALHGRTACVAVFALYRAPGAPRPFDGQEVTEACRAATLEDIRMADSDRLPGPVLRAITDAAITGLRQTDVISAAPTPTRNGSIDSALDMPAAAQTEGPTCIAMLMPETSLENARLCARRVVARLAATPLPRAPGLHVCAAGGVAEVIADAEGGRDAMLRTLENAYAGIEAARRDQRLVGVRAA
ncbi:hypothetical protein ACQ5SO_07310 [Rhodovulum sp. DZ06]|uniref:hypothetical protein n=1 Tax=Rhodovulum sp. DZ06 TaxID=3425126 RepID=UPI003D32E207